MAIDEDEWEGHKRNLARMLALSDGVFAVAITLLVLDIKLPENVSLDQLLTALFNQLPGFWSFVVSFLVVGLYWNAHRRTFHVVRRFDGRLTWINIFFLMSISFLPVPTSVLGRYDSVIAVVFYAICMTVTGLLSFSLWWYATARHRLVDATLDPRIIVFRGFMALVAPTIFLLSIGLAFINIFAPALPGPKLAEYSWYLIAIIMFTAGRRFRSGRSGTE